MPTPILDARSTSERPSALARAALVLRSGGLVAFPTETVYGLGANALDPAAVRRIFAAKGRPAHNPLIVHVAAVADAARLAEWSDEATKLAERFWPGPLTLVLPRRAGVPDEVTAGGPTVAVRLPAHPVARELIALADVPLAAPSANRSGSLSPTAAEHVGADLGGLIDLILDGGPTTGGIESTVLDLSRRPARLLRPGLVTPGEIEAVIGPIVRAAVAPSATEALPSPGMLTRHYAPKTPLTLVEELTAESLAGRVSRGERLVLLYRVADFGKVPSWDGFRGLGMPNDADGYARVLYGWLRAVDEQGHDRIVVLLPPDEEAWQAIRDRLSRAAAPE